MNDPKLRRLVAQALPGYEDVIGRALWVMEDTRQRTKKAIDGMSDQTLNWVRPDEGNNIATLLYHIAAIEMDWLYIEILQQQELPPGLKQLLRYDVRDTDGKLSRVTAETVDGQLHRLATTRGLFLSSLSGMTSEEFRRPRRLPDFEVTPEWVVHHLVQHEAEHRGQIAEIRKMAEAALIADS